MVESFVFLLVLFDNEQWDEDVLVQSFRFRRFSRKFFVNSLAMSDCFRDELKSLGATSTEGELHVEWEQ